MKNKALLFTLLGAILFAVGFLNISDMRIAAQSIQTLNAEAFSKQMQTAKDYQMVDVRTPEEFQSGHIATAINMNLYDGNFSEQLQSLNKEKPVFVYCKAGSRSATAANTMKEMGFKTIYDLKGGILAWTNAGMPTEGGAQNAVDKFTPQDFQKLITSEKAVLVDFYARWCLPCKKMEPVLDALAKEYKGKVTIARINIDEAKTLVKELGVKEIPVVNTYKSAVLFSAVNGYQSEAELRTIIQNLLQ